MAMVGSGDILGLLPTGRHTDTTDRTGRHLLALLAGDPLCPSWFPSVHELLLVTVYSRKAPKLGCSAEASGSLESYAPLIQRLMKLIAFT